MVHLLIAAALALSSVERITIQSSWGGLGSGRYALADFVREGPLLKYGTETLARREGDALLRALSRKGTQAPSPTSLGMRDPNWIKQTVDSTLRSCVGDAADIPAVRALYLSWYSNPITQSEWMRGYYSDGFMRTDDYPSESVVVTLKDGQTIRASSASQRAYMVPFRVTIGSTSLVSYDPALPRAIVAVFPADVNADRLSGEELSADFGQQICSDRGSTLGAKTVSAYFPGLIGALTDNSTVSDVYVSSDLATIQARVKSRRVPNIDIAFEVTGRALDSNNVTRVALQQLKKTRSIVERVAAIPWLRAAFARSPSSSMRLDDDLAGAHWDVEDLKRAGRTRIAGYLQQNLGSALEGVIYGAHDQIGTHWYVFQNGDLLFMDYTPSPGVSFPFTTEQVRAFAADKGLHKAPAGANRGDGATVGAIVHPNGTIDLTP